MSSNITTSWFTADKITEVATTSHLLPETMTTEITNKNGFLNWSSSVVITLAVIAIILWVFAVISNALVCIVIQRSKRLQSTTNYFVVSLACADHVFAITVMPFIFSEIVAGEWLLGQGMCKLVRTLLHWTPGITMLILICICTDRYYTILYPLCFKITRKRAKQMIAMSWLTALVISLPALYFFHAETYPNDKDYCLGFVHSGDDPHQIAAVVYTVLYTILLYITPTVLVLTVYIKIFRYIWRFGSDGRTFQRTTNPVPRTKVKMVKLIMVVNAAILFLVSPYFIAQLWHCSLSEEDNGPNVFIAVVFIYLASICAKPGLYLCYNSNFRRGCREVFCTSTMKCYRRNIYTVTVASKLGRQNHIGVVQGDVTSVTVNRMPTPSKTFNRARNVEQSAWPLGNASPSTYL